MPASDVFIMVLVTLVTAVLHNLALAVLIGVVVAALVFAWDNAVRIRARKRVDEQGWKHYELYGPLFFGSTTVFAEKFDVEGDPEHVVLDFQESRVVDMSAIEALNRLTSRYARAGKKVHLRHLSEDCRALIDKAESIIEVNHFEDPTYKVVRDLR
jgi:SulP family sulfate permease